jgi:ribonuclease-3
MTLQKKSGNYLSAILPFLFKKHLPASEHDAAQKMLHHAFADPSLLTHALTHKSYASTNDDRQGLFSNERMEFLGDAVLNCLITEHLYLRFPDKAEGQLSKIKSLIVSRKILGEVAVAIGLGDHVLLGPSEQRPGGEKRISILSNAFEAVIGAIYLDGGPDKARTFLKTHLFHRIDEFLSDERHINYKSAILEKSQRDGLGIPRYSVMETTGPEHAKKFTVQVEIAGIPMGKGYGSNKKTAQQDAAQKALANYDTTNIISRIKGAQNDELVSDRRAADDSGHGA